MSQITKFSSLLCLIALPIGGLLGCDNGRQQPLGAFNMVFIMGAVHDYQLRNGHLPTNVLDEDGKALLSWRVKILPELGYKELFDSLRLDEAWNSEHNIQFLHEMPPEFSFVGSRLQSGHTAFLAPLHPTTVLGGGAINSRGVPSIVTVVEADGTSNTVFLIKVEERYSVPWTKPEDLVVDMKNPLNKVALPGNRDFLIALTDGTVHSIPSDVPPQMFAAWLTCNGQDADFDPGNQ